jgi:hypothetical protein
MHADELETVTHSYCALSKRTRLTSDSTISDMMPDPELSERLLGGKGLLAFIRRTSCSEPNPMSSQGATKDSLEQTRS